MATMDKGDRREGIYTMQQQPHLSAGVMPGKDTHMTRLPREALQEQRHVRLIVDFIVTIDESVIPTDGVNSNLGPNSSRGGSDTYWRQRDDANRDLLHAIHDNPKLLEAFLKYLVSCELENLNWSEWHDLFLGNSDADEAFDSIMQSIIPSLNQSLQQFFAGSEDVFQQIYDNGCIECFQFDLAHVHLASNHKIEEDKS